MYVKNTRIVSNYKRPEVLNKLYKCFRKFNKNMSILLFREGQ
jgi:hypothetical protein